MPTPENPPFDRRGYVILTLTIGDRREVSGFGIEILDTGGGQNEAGRNGRIYFALGQDQPDPSRPAEPFIQTYGGNREMIRFDRIYYTNGPTTAYVLGANPVRVKVFTEPKTAWTDTEPAGVPRSRMLARSPSGGVVAAALGSAGDAITVYRNDGQIEDRYWEEGQFDERMFWWGAITGNRSFECYVETKLNAFDPHRHWIQKFAAIDYSASVNARMAAYQPGPDATFVMDFTVGTNSNTRNNVSNRLVFPAGIVALHVLNLDAGGANTIRYCVGVVGHQ